MNIGEISGVVRRKVGDQIYYFGTTDSKNIKGITFVPVIEPSKKTYVQENTEDGYQRPGSRLRMLLFMNYLLEKPNSIVPPVLLSGRGGWEYEPSKSDKHYGQHRIGGFIALFEDKEISRDIDFILLEGLTKEEEVEEFITVNNSAKGVPKPLTAYLEDTESSRLAWALNEEPDSPFKGRISRIKVGKDQLFALHSVANEIEDHFFNHGKLAEFDEETKLDTLKRYWTIIADELDEQWADIENLKEESGGKKNFQFKLLELTGFIVWCRLAPEILGRSYTSGSGMNWAHVENLVASCGHIDWRKDGQYIGRTGLVGASAIVKDIQRKLPADPNAAPTEE